MGILGEGRLRGEEGLREVVRGAAFPGEGPAFANSLAQEGQSELKKMEEGQ